MNCEEILYRAKRYDEYFKNLPEASILTHIRMTELDRVKIELNNIEKSIDNKSKQEPELAKFVKNYIANIDNFITQVCVQLSAHLNKEIDGPQNTMNRSFLYNNLPVLKV